MEISEIGTSTSGQYDAKMQAMKTATKIMDRWGDVSPEDVIEVAEKIYQWIIKTEEV